MKYRIRYEVITHYVIDLEAPNELMAKYMAAVYDEKEFIQIDKPCWTFYQIEEVRG